MSGLRPGLYAQWRAQNEARFLLREKVGTQPPESLLQSVWHHQRLHRDQLQTLDGQKVRVLHPGFWNHEAGPDFRGAVVQIGQDPARSGDVEIDLERRNWQAHHHEGNPAFANVILHVVWNDGPGKSNQLPTLALENFLDTPLNEMQNWAGSPVAEEWPNALRGACSAPLSCLTEEQRVGLLQQAALVRFQRKALDIEIRARQAGWEQALWEGLFRALGYKANIWPMQRVAELIPILDEPGISLFDWQARLLGISGFLGASAEKARQNKYLQTLWDHWWRDREKFEDVALPKSLWRMNGLRPANQPQRRLALAAHWLASKDFTGELEEWFTSQEADSLPKSLLKCLQPPPDEFWSRHWSFQTPRLAKAQPLLGESRATDLAINVILPWFWIRARAGRNQRLTALAEQQFLAWPAAQDNSLLRLARQRLLGSVVVSRRPKSAATQQGLMQIVRDFCDHSNAVCANCSFPDVVRQLAEESAGDSAPAA